MTSSYSGRPADGWIELFRRTQLTNPSRDGAVGVGVNTDRVATAHIIYDDRLVSVGKRPFVLTGQTGLVRRRMQIASDVRQRQHSSPRSLCSRASDSRGSFLFGSYTMKMLQAY
jgi:hypothetical protein